VPSRYSSIPVASVFVGDEAGSTSVDTLSVLVSVRGEHSLEVGSGKTY
jgi:hypothetical protein